MQETIEKELQLASEFIQLRFEKLPVLSDQLYAVYTRYQGDRCCFHLLFNPTNLEFEIFDKHNCPNEIILIEGKVSQIIEHYHA